MNLIGVTEEKVDDKRIMSTKRKGEHLKMQGILQNAEDEADGVLCSV